MIQVKLLPIHQKLLTAAAILALASFAAWYLLVLPLREGVDAQQSQVTAKRKELQNYPVRYPLDPAKLEQLKGQWATQKQEVRERLEAVLNRPGVDFTYADPEQPGELAAYGGVLTFMPAITTLNYQVEYTELRKYLRDRGVELYEPTLGLKLETTSRRNYQLVAHLWTIRRLADLALKHNLDLAEDRRVTIDHLGGTREIRPSSLAALPVESYVTPGSDEPFLEEYPVSVTVRGPVKDVTAFLLALTGDEHFLPLSRCLIEKDGANRVYDTEFDQVKATLVCSAFLIMKDKGSLLGSTACGEADPLPQWSPGS